MHPRVTVQGGGTRIASRYFIYGLKRYKRNACRKLKHLYKMYCATKLAEKKHTVSVGC